MLPLFSNSFYELFILKYIFADQAKLASAKDQLTRLFR